MCVEEEFRFVRYRRSIIIVVVLLVAGSCQSDRRGDPGAGDRSGAESTGCAEMDLLEQVGCLADLAVRQGDLGACDAASHEGVQYQCYAVVAERQDDQLICQQIPSTTAEHLSLKDLCLSDIAKNRLDPELCSAVRAAGVRDGCYFTVAEGIPDRSLCVRVTDQGLRRLCAEEPMP